MNAPRNPSIDNPPPPGRAPRASLDTLDEVGHSRRRFLTGVGAMAGAVVAGHVVGVWGRPVTAAGAAVAAKGSAKAAGAKGRTVVFVELAGGNDAISTVVPHADPAYRQLRPTLAIDAPIDLDGSVGLHPNLAKLAERYRAGQVAIVEGVGDPEGDLSHFASLANWWSGEKGRAGTSGWLGRYLDETVGFDDPLAGVVIGPGPSPALVGERSFATSISDASGLSPRAPAWLSAPDDLVEEWARFGTSRADRSALLGQVRQAIALTGDARRDLGRMLTPSATDDDALSAQAYGGSSVATSFDLAARLVTSARPPKVVYLTNLGDFDTHQGQAQRHPTLMAELDAGIDHLLGAVEAAGAADKVIVMTLSEFGRRARENGSGTDHGSGSAHLFIGARVEGGRYGQPTSLATLDSRGNLPVSVDFRSMYATALEGWLGTDAEPILGKGFTAQKIFA
ncbi:MAG: hypothetical protein AMXMBFR46_05770 [Acidimicrobiia bacterium]